MKNDKLKNSLKKAAFYLLSIVFWVLLWHFAATLANKELILKIPRPLDTLKIFIEDLGNVGFWGAVGTSVLHIALGFAIAAAVGTLGGAMSAGSRFFDTLSSPLLHMIRSVPVAAFIFIAWLWIPSSLLPSFISALMVIPIIWSHVRSGIEAADVRYSEMGRVFGMSKKDILLKIRLPLVSPHLRAGCTTGLGIAWKSGVAAEVICNPTGSVGALLQKGKATVEYGEVFAVTLAVILLSLILENLLKLLWNERFTAFLSKIAEKVFAGKKSRRASKIKASGNNIAAPGNTSVEFKNVSFSYGSPHGRKKVLDGFSIKIEKGEKICLFGPSGCGKSTVLRLICGLEKQSFGDISIQSKNICPVFQEDRLLPFLTVKENAEMFSDGKDAGDIISSLGLSEAANEYPTRLSGGMARRAAIARALSKDGDIYIMDEPFNGLDEKNVEAAAELIKNMTAGKTLICVLHDKNDAELLGCKTVQM